MALLIDGINGKWWWMGPVIVAVGLALLVQTVKGLFTTGSKG